VGCFFGLDTVTKRSLIHKTQPALKNECVNETEVSAYVRRTHLAPKLQYRVARKRKSLENDQLKLHCVSKTPTFSILNNSTKKMNRSNNFGYEESWGNFTSENCKLANLTWRVLPHYLVSCISSHAACRIVNSQTIHQPALLRAIYLLLGKTIITSVNWTLQTRHTVDRGDMDTYFVMYRWSKTLNSIIITAIHCKQSYFCVWRGSAVTLFRWGGRVYNF